ncbi:fibronectin type III domain-containing protein [Marinobacter sediminum]|uniref:fibronectin type III domain-containing protein n=1 Tax=Marinobacter sediminum TaxID=256323 RepID=UPI0020303B7A|nr:fibronectin type III domain-containing protein [Marinobacter sediminum]
MKLSQAWIAAFVLGILLAGCGGGSASSGSSAVLSWSAPLKRVNGESIPMAELDQYVIRYGHDAGNLTEKVIVVNAQAEAEMSYEVNGLDNGTWYFTIQVQDTNGLISAPSEVVSKSIQS